jgi:NAD-dependent dihydropyrimidine dehydrogenase PreA subunit
MSELKYLEDVVTLSLDSGKCNSCGMCIDVCPHAVFAMIGKNVQIIDRNACMECGACAVNCPAKAIKVEAGVGCAAAVITGYLTGKEPTCGCDDKITQGATTGDSNNATDTSCCGPKNTSCC